MYFRASVRLLSIVSVCAFTGCTFKVEGDPDVLLNPTKVKAELQSQFYLEHGNELVKLRRFDEAIAQYSEFVKLEPENAMGYNNRGYCWIQKQQWEKALADLDESIRLAEDLKIAHENRLSVSRAMSDSENIIVDTNHLLRLDPTDIAALIYRGIARSTVGEYKTAAEDFRQALSLNTNSNAAHNGLAWLLATAPDPRLRDGPTAVKHAKAAVSSPNGMNSTYVDTLAAAFAECEMFDKAVICQRQAIELAKNESDRQELETRLEIFKSRRPFRTRSISE